MARISIIGGKKVLELTNEEAAALEGKEQGALEIVKAKEGVWVMLAAPASLKPGTGKPADEEANVVNLLYAKPLSERVEGQFEKFLTKSEQERLKQLVKSGKVERFRLSDKYKKAIYRVRRAQEPRAEEAPKKKGPMREEDMLLQQKGYLMVSNEERAKRMSSEYEELIKGRQLKGIKSFDGRFYLVLADVYQRGMEKITRALKEQGDIALDELSTRTGLDKELTKVICEFMKEDGELMERKREQYAYVG